MDEIELLILNFLNESIRVQPFSVSEIFQAVHSKNKTVTRAKIIYRLVKLRGDKKIYGKLLGDKRGVWIYWKRRKRRVND